MVRTKAHANSALSGAKKTHKGYNYVQKTMHGLATLCAIGSLIASAICAHKAHKYRGDDDDDDDDGGHYKMARNVSIAAAVWSGLTILQQGGQGGDQWKHATKVAKLRKLRRNNNEDQRGLNAGGATDYGYAENRRRQLIHLAIQAAVIIFGIVVLAIWANPLMKRTYRNASFISSLKAWGILGWIALGLLILGLLIALLMLFTKKRHTVDNAGYDNAAYGDTAYTGTTATTGNVTHTGPMAHSGNMAHTGNAAYTGNTAYTGSTVPIGNTAYVGNQAPVANQATYGTQPQMTSV